MALVPMHFAHTHARQVALTYFLVSSLLFFVQTAPASTAAQASLSNVALDIIASLILDLSCTKDP